MQNGFAVAVDGVIQVATVAPTEISAIVNGLSVVFGLMLWDYEDDEEEIRQQWRTFCVQSTRAVEVKPVTVFGEPS